MASLPRSCRLRGEPRQLDLRLVERRAGARSGPRARRPARSGCPCRRRARRPPWRGWRPRGSAPHGRDRRRAAAAARARARPARSARPVLAVLLRPVERAVGEADQLVAADALHRVGRDAGAHRHRADLVDLERADPLDDRARDRDGRAFVEPGQQDGELVAAEPERLAALAQRATRPAPSTAVADRMAVAVVDRLKSSMSTRQSAERGRRPARPLRAPAGGARGSWR